MATNGLEIKVEPVECKRCANARLEGIGHRSTRCPECLELWAVEAEFMFAAVDMTSRTHLKGDKTYTNAVGGKQYDKIAQAAARILRDSRFGL